MLYMVIESRNLDSWGLEYKQKQEKRHNPDGYVPNQLCAGFSRVDAEGVCTWHEAFKRTDFAAEV